jgi:membrane protein DedA with SNARE-associated domain
MKIATIISGLLAIFISVPIWFYLVYKILQAVNATELMWFLYWIYVPVVLSVYIISTIVRASKEK